MVDRLRTSEEMAARKISQLSANANQPSEGIGDTALEAFLRLLDPELPLPRAVVEPQEIKLRLDKGENKELSLRIGNQGRGYLSGTIELSEEVPGLEISAHQFGLHSKAGKAERETSVSLRVNSDDLEASREYRTSLVINTNGEPDNIIVPLSILAAGRKERSREMTGHFPRWGKWAIATACMAVLIIGAIVIFGEERKVAAIHDFQIDVENGHIVMTFYLADAIGRPMSKVDARIGPFLFDGREFSLCQLIDFHRDYLNLRRDLCFIRHLCFRGSRFYSSYIGIFRGDRYNKRHFTGINYEQLGNIVYSIEREKSLREPEKWAFKNIKERNRYIITVLADAQIGVMVVTNDGETVLTAKYPLAELLSMEEVIEILRKDRRFIHFAKKIDEQIAHIPQKLAPPAPAPPAPTPAPAPAPIPVAIPKIYPAKLEGNIKVALRDTGVVGVTAEVDDNLEVTLGGFVGSRYKKDKAVEVAKSFEEVKRIRDIIFVVEPAKLEGTINRALRDAGLRGITAKVDDNLGVALRGSVRSRHKKERAVEVAKSFEEVKRIRDLIFVVEPAKLEGTINRALRDAGLRGITAKVDDNLGVALRGSVRSRHKKERAVEVAKSFEEVKRIRDLIFVVE